MNKLFTLRPMSELVAIVKRDLRKLDDEGLIDEGVLVKTVAWCNDKLGILIRDIKQCIIPVEEYKAELPLDFEKLYFTCATSHTNSMITNYVNPFDNTFDRDIIYEAEIDRDSFGGTVYTGITINKKQNLIVQNIQNWTPLNINTKGAAYCHMDCPNNRTPGKYTITLKENEIETPFRKGELYIMYIGALKDQEGNILFPFNPLITPFYEWALKEKVLQDALFNSDMNFQENQALLALASKQRGLAYLDAWDITTTQEYGEFVKAQRDKELKWYNQWFKYF